MTILADDIRHLCHDLSIMLGAKALSGPDLLRAIGLVGRVRANPAHVPAPRLMRHMQRVVEGWKADAFKEVGE